MTRDAGASKIRFPRWSVGTRGKDYFYFKEGASLSITEQNRGRLFQRMRGLLNSESLPTLLTGTVVLAVAANSYELLCTADFPVVWHGNHSGCQEDEYICQIMGFRHGSPMLE